MSSRLRHIRNVLDNILREQLTEAGGGTIELADGSVIYYTGEDIREAFVCAVNQQSHWLHPFLLEAEIVGRPSSGLAEMTATLEKSREANWDGEEEDL